MKQIFKRLIDIYFHIQKRLNKMDFIELLFIFIVDYLLIGIFKTYLDFAGPQINRPMYTYSPSLSKIVTLTIIWPFALLFLIINDIQCGNFKKIFSTTFKYLFIIIGTILWTFIAYSIADKIASNLFVKLLIIISLLAICLFIATKLLVRKSSENRLRDLI